MICVIERCRDGQLLQSTISPGSTEGKSLVFWLGLYLLFIEVFCILFDCGVFVTPVLKDSKGKTFSLLPDFVDIR